MLLEMIRSLRGYVRIRISGRFPERFINITSRGGIRLWQVERSGDGFTAAMYRSDYRRARPLARAAGVRLRLSAKCGLPAFFGKWRDRMGLAVGAFVFVLTVFVMSQFIWSIEITGLNAVSESELRAQLREHGLYIGAFSPGLDDRQISRSVMLDNGRVGWMAINLMGSCACVEVKEEAPVPAVPDFRQPVNIKARCDGTILRIEAGEGTVLLKEGSGVAAGQLVVSGVMEDKLGGSRLVRADARVIAATTHGASFSVPDTPTVYVPDGEEGARLTAYLFGMRLPLSGYAPHAGDCLTDERLDIARLMDVDLPLGVIRERVSGLESKTLLLNDNSAKEILYKESRLYEWFTLAGCTVTDRAFTLTHHDGVYTLDVVYHCVEDIAERSVIGTDEGTQRVRIPSVE